MAEDHQSCPAADQWKKEKQAEFNINRKIFVGNISYRIKSRKLSHFFTKFGRVEFCYIAQDHLKRWSRGIAFVTFEDEESMKRALAAGGDELILDNREMRVKPAYLSPKTTYWMDNRETDNGDLSSVACDVLSTDIVEQNNTEVEDKQTEEGGSREGYSVTEEGASREGYSVTEEGASREGYSVTEEGASREGYSVTEEGASREGYSVTEEGASREGYSVTLEDLYDEILIHVFYLLSWKERMAVERVCWRWKRNIEKTWSMIKTLHFQNVFKRFGGLTDKMLNSVLLRCGRCLVALDLSASPRVLTHFAMDVIGKYCPDLVELDLTAVKVTNISMKNLVSKCTKLQKVTLKKCMYITDKGVQYLLRGCRDLNYFDITDLQLLSGQCFQTVGEKLKTLVLTDCHKIDDSAVHAIVSCSRYLEELHISNCRNLSSIAVRNICQNSSELAVLHFSAASIKVESEALCCLKKLQNLVTLDMSFSVMVNDQVLRAVTEGCLKLKYVDISGCHQVSDVGIQTLHKLSGLLSLNISYLSQVCEDSIIKIAPHIGKLRKLIARATKFMTDEAVLTITTLCPFLEHLDLSGCFQISNKIFDGLNMTFSLDSDQCIELYLGGTSIDWLADNVDWLSGLPHLKVFTHNLAMEELRSDREIILPGDLELSDEENEYSPHPSISDFISGPVEAYDDWDDNFDDYLENDDPVAAERWDLS